MFRDRLGQEVVVGTVWVKVDTGFCCVISEISQLTSYCDGFRVRCIGLESRHVYDFGSIGRGSALTFADRGCVFSSFEVIGYVAR
jgi:hypothetical protein